MNIKLQIILTVILTAAISSVLSAISSFNTGLTVASDSLKKEVEDALSLQTHQSKIRIEGYLNQIASQIHSLSQSPVILNSIEELSQAYSQFNSESYSVNDDVLKSYYTKEFSDKYQTINNGESTNVEPLINTLSQNTIALQTAYIASNPFPLGEKHNLLASNNSNSYDKLHASIHPYLKSFLNEFGYYDIFLVEPENGNVVYTVFKEIDYATSLIHGPFANSGLGHVFRKAMESKENTSFVDFAPYLPSYHMPASFISEKIIKKGKVVGVLIFQMPVNTINNIMNNTLDWQSLGLGMSGETYLVGEDLLMRSESRFVLENKA
ncbi:MAG: hypothetical protein P1U57_12620, partial [Oleibacter sp.]|nr:hypothetical protein [Thalassolituus sp.]